VVSPPCMIPVKAYPTVIEGGAVFTTMEAAMHEWLSRRQVGRKAAE